LEDWGKEEEAGGSLVGEEEVGAVALRWEGGGGFWGREAAPGWARLLGLGGREEDWGFGEGRGFPSGSFGAACMWGLDCPSCCEGVDNGWDDGGFPWED